MFQPREDPFLFTIGQPGIQILLISFFGAPKIALSEPLPFGFGLLLVLSLDDNKAGMTVMMVLFISHAKGLNIIIKMMKNIKKDWTEGGGSRRMFE